MAEYLPFKERVVGSSPTRPTICLILRPHRLVWSRTLAFHAGNMGSNPLGDAIKHVKAFSVLLKAFFVLAFLIFLVSFFTFGVIKF